MSQVLFDPKLHTVYKPRFLLTLINSVFPGTSTEHLAQYIPTIGILSKTFYETSTLGEGIEKQTSLCKFGDGLGFLVQLLCKRQIQGTLTNMSIDTKFVRRSFYAIIC